jgi:hypothetical protein
MGMPGFDRGPLQTGSPQVAYIFSGTGPSDANAASTQVQLWTQPPRSFGLTVPSGQAKRHCGMPSQDALVSLWASRGRPASAVPSSSSGQAPHSSASAALSAWPLERPQPVGD